MACFAHNQIHHQLDMNWIISFLRKSCYLIGIYLKMFGFSLKNVRYSRYQMLHFFNFACSTFKFKIICWKPGEKQNSLSVQFQFQLLVIPKRQIEFNSQNKRFKNKNHWNHCIFHLCFTSLKICPRILLYLLVQT